MRKLTREDLYSLEEYAGARSDFRRRVMRHKKTRLLSIGPHASLYFEDRLTMQYQVQEMLRAERIFETDEIQAELEAYNPLIPDGANLKATFMLEYDDVEARRGALAKLLGIEDRVWMRVEGFDRVWSIADEDMERENADKTSAVHFLRFEFSPEMVAAAKGGAPLSAGIDHPQYSYRVDPLAREQRDALAADFD